MDYAVVQSCKNTAASSTTVAAGSAGTPWSQNVASGNKIIAIVAASTSQAISSVADAASNAWTLIGGAHGSAGSGAGAAVFALDVPAGDVGTKPVLTATVGSAGTLEIVCLEVSGLLAGNTTAMIDAALAAVEEIPTSSQAQPAYTSGASGYFLLSVLADNGNSVTYALPGYTLDGNSIQGSSSGDLVAGSKSSTGGAESGTWGATGTPTGSVLMVVAFKLATAAGPAAGIVQAPRTTIPRPAPSRSRIITPQASGPSTWAAAGTASSTSSASGAFTPALLTGTAASVSAATGAVTMTGPVTWDAAGSAAGTSSASGGFTPALLTASAAGASSASGGFTQVIAAAAASTSTAAGFFSSALLPLAPVWPQVFSLPLDLSHSPAADPAGTPVPFPNGIVIWNSGGTAFRFVNTDGLPQVIAFMPVYPWASNGDPIVAAPYVIPALSTVWVGAHDVPHYGNRTWIIASSPAVLVTAFEP